MVEIADQVSVAWEGFEERHFLEREKEREERREKEENFHFKKKEGRKEEKRRKNGKLKN